MTLIPSSRTSLGTPVWEGTSLDGIGKIKVTGSGEYNSSYRLNLGLGQHRTAENCGVLQIGGTTMNENNISDGAYNGRMQFEFPVPVTIISHDYKSRGSDTAVNPNADGKLQYSNDGTTWKDSGWTYGANITNKNTVNSFTINLSHLGGYRYWRFFYPTKNATASGSGSNNIHGLTRWGYIVGYSVLPPAPTIPFLSYGDRPIKKIMYGGREIRPEPPIDYIELTAEITAANQTVIVNKYFANAHTIDWGDGSPVANHTADTTHTYSAAGTYKIKLTLAGGATRWTFGLVFKPLVPTEGTTASNIYISSMPSLADYFGANATNPGNLFFYYFNCNGALTSLPENSFNTSNITTVGDFFFYSFNYNGALTSLPAGSFILSQLPVASRTSYFDSFNSGSGKLTKQVGGIQIKNAHNAAINFHYWNGSSTVSESVSSGNSFNGYTVG